MVVQHNLRAMNSNRMLGLTTATQAKSTEKLSSGYKINRAADDAAGLTISEKMRRQIRGLTQASLNAQDGISAVQTAEGALTEVHDMLQRMDELATKAANGTMSQDDRQAVQDEIDQLITEIDRVSETTKFNELDLLKGDGTETKKVNTPAEAAVAVKAEYVSGKGQSSVKLKEGEDAPTWYAKDGTSALTADQVLDYLTINDDGDVVLKDGAELFTAAANETSEFGDQKEGAKVNDAAAQAVYEVGTSKISTAEDGSALVEAEDLKDQFNADGSMKAKLYAQKAGGGWEEIGAEQIDKFVKVTPGKEEVAAGEKDVEVTKALTFKLHVGSESEDANKIEVTIQAMSAKGIGVDGLKTKGVMDQDSATKAIDTIKNAVSIVSKQRSALGAVQNRLEHTINNLDNVVENTTAAESQIRDTNMATEMVKYSNNNILAQAGQAMLAQSNQANQGVLSLLQ